MKQITLTTEQAEFVAWHLEQRLTTLKQILRDPKPSLKVMADAQNLDTIIKSIKGRL